MKEKTFTGLYLDAELLDTIAVFLSQANCRTRNEFINQAIRFYIAHLNARNYSDILTPALESVISAKIADTENRLARVIFKLSVETAMMYNIVAGTNQINQSKLAELRKLCVEEVSKLNGRYNFEDAVKFQKG